MHGAAQTTQRVSRRHALGRVRGRRVGDDGILGVLLRSHFKCTGPGSYPDIGHCKGHILYKILRGLTPLNLTELIFS